MKRIDDDTITITQAEADSIRCFIDNALHYAWDQHTNKFICSDTRENGKRQMDPELYDMAIELGSI